MHILVIDDEETIVDGLMLTLRRQHHTTTILRDVDEQPAFVARLEKIQPDGVILDFGMEREGDKVYGWIKAWRRSVKVVFYTCYANTEGLRQKMLAAGASEREIVRKTEVGNDIRELLMVLT